MRLVLVAALAASLLSASGSYAAPFGTPSATTPALDPIANFYQKRVVNNSCNTAGQCSATFPAINSTRALITHVSCIFFLPTGSTVIGVVLITPDLTSSNALQPFLGDSIDGLTQYAINTETYYFIDKGIRPVVTVKTTATVGNLDCTISGYHD